MAQMILTVNDTHVPRIRAAFGTLLGTVDENGVARDATAEEIRQYLIEHIKDRVIRQEQLAAQQPALDVT